jgi:adenine/guanine phosphoribosyltransferase-like PRPP-binding protein
MHTASATTLAPAITSSTATVLDAPHGRGAAFVMTALGMEIDDSSTPLSFGAITGMALRNNPKRAHLLVSKVLGKHYPQSPAIIDGAAQILAHKVHARIEPVADATILPFLVEELARGLASPDETDILHAELPAVTVPLVVVGYAEAAASLGASVAEKLHAYYLSSTRYPAQGAARFGAFEEEHSHASSHFLTPSDDRHLMNRNAIVVLVDDELTSGRTIMNTIRMLQAAAPRKTYVVATLADLRDATARTKMEEFAASFGIAISVVSLFSGELEVPAMASDTAQEVISMLPADNARAAAATVVPSILSRAFTVPHARDGIDDYAALATTISELTELLLPSITGRTLFLGIEEDMFLPLKLAKAVEDRVATPTRFGATTRSPAFAHDHPDYGIKDRLAYEVQEVPGDTSARFAYNLGFDYDLVVIVTSNPAETANLGGLIDALTGRTQRIIVLEAQPAAEDASPLYGPAFGSYLRDDVAWLLKDLSGFDLEIAVEDREEAVLSGGMHYAERLPVEFQPSDEYQTLFAQALEKSAATIALHVGVVAEQIYAARDGRPVLVSLARAGTPIGVLIRRYLLAAYGVDTPHYAVSIVRGKGIDHNALRHIARHHDASRVMFVDGWTGKGAIVRELVDAIEDFASTTGIRFDPSLAVLADPGSCVSIFGTRDDYLIPSASLNSTVSGLISRTVLNDEMIGVNDFHGGKFYRELATSDVSNHYIDTVAALFGPALIDAARAAVPVEPAHPDWSGWAAVSRISESYGIHNVNLVKPGVGETTRVLLRRVPWKVLVRSGAGQEVDHIRLLAATRGVPVESVDDLPYTAIGLIHPTLTRGAVGADGRSAA